MTPAANRVSKSDTEMLQGKDVIVTPVVVESSCMPKDECADACVYPTWGIRRARGMNRRENKALGEGGVGQQLQGRATTTTEAGECCGAESLCMRRHVGANCYSITYNSEREEQGTRQATSPANTDARLHAVRHTCMHAHMHARA